MIERFFSQKIKIPYVGRELILKIFKAWCWQEIYLIKRHIFRENIQTKQSKIFINTKMIKFSLIR
jgi:hypothetical protein